MSELRRLFANLLDNGAYGPAAARSPSAGGWIRQRSGRLRSRWWKHPQRRLAHLFDRFIAGLLAFSGFGGSRLGLAIVRFFRRHKGMSGCVESPDRYSSLRASAAMVSGQRQGDVCPSRHPGILDSAMACGWADVRVGRSDFCHCVVAQEHIPVSRKIGVSSGSLQVRSLKDDQLDVTTGEAFCRPIRPFRNTDGWPVNGR